LTWKTKCMLAWLQRSGQIMCAIDARIAISRRNNIVVETKCYDIVVLRSPWRYRTSRSYNSGPSSASSRPRPGIFEAKAKATKFCPRAVLEVEASPRGPHPYTKFRIVLELPLACCWNFCHRRSDWQVQFVIRAFMIAFLCSFSTSAWVCSISTSMLESVLGFKIIGKMFSCWSRMIVYCYKS